MKTEIIILCHVKDHLYKSTDKVFETLFKNKEIENITLLHAREIEE